MAMRLSRRQFGALSASLVTALVAGPALAQQRRGTMLVPGTGQRVAKGDDDFETDDFVWYPAHPKASYDIDKNIRVPGGISKSLRWVEAAKRGAPDVVKRVKTPPGGIEGSTGAMQIKTLYSGVPGELSYRDQQDDLLYNLSAQVGGYIPVAHSPNCTVRVYIPKDTEWEPLYHHAFGYRAGLIGTTPTGKTDEYWPGFFFEQKYELKDGEKLSYVQTWVRADPMGRDMPGPKFYADSWATLGMSFTPDGQCHFYARKGVDDLTEEDHLGTYYSYNWRAHTFQTYFFNVMNRDDGRSWSTPWTIDDPKLFVATPPYRAAARSSNERQ